MMNPLLQYERKPCLRASATSGMASKCNGAHPNTEDGSQARLRPRSDMAVMRRFKSYSSYSLSCVSWGTVVPETRPCIICGCELESAFDESFPFQPYKGGEVTFYFHYGSVKFDLNMFGTKFAGIICDDCAEKCVERMKMTPVSDRVPKLLSGFSDTFKDKLYTKGIDNLKRINEGKPRPDFIPPSLDPLSAAKKLQEKLERDIQKLKRINEGKPPKQN